MSLKYTGMKKHIFLSLFLIIVTKVISQPNFSIESFGPDFDRSVNIKHARDTRLFIVEQDGLLQILSSNGKKTNKKLLII